MEKLQPSEGAQGRRRGRYALLAPIVAYGIVLLLCANLDYGSVLLRFPSGFTADIVPRLALVFGVLIFSLVHGGVLRLDRLALSAEHVGVFVLVIFCHVSLFLLFRGTAFGLWGLQGDTGFLSAMITKAKFFAFPVDATYKGLHAFHPELYQFVLGKIAALFGLPSVAMTKYGFLAAFLVLPLAIYLSWERLVGRRAAFLVTVATSLWLPFLNLHKTAEMASLFFFLPWWLGCVVRDGDPEGKDPSRRTALAGVVGALLFMTYYYWFFAGAVYLAAEVVLDLRGGGSWKEALRARERSGRVLALSALFSSPYWAPLLWDMLRFGSAPMQNRWYEESMGKLWTGNGSIFELMLIGGFVGAFVRIRGPFRRPIVLLLFSCGVWFAVGYASLLLDAPVLHSKMAHLGNYVLVVSFVLSLLSLLDAGEAWLAGLGTNGYLAVAVLLLLAGGEVFLGIKDDEGYRQAFAQVPRLDWEEDAARTESLRGKVLLTDKSYVTAYSPCFMFLSINPHFSHPASRFRERLAFLERLATVHEPVALVWLLRNNRFDRVDYLWISGNLSLTVFDDNFPQQYRPVRIAFDPSLALSPYVRRVDWAPSQSGTLYELLDPPEGASRDVLERYRDVVEKYAERR